MNQFDEIAFPGGSLTLEFDSAILRIRELFFDRLSTATDCAIQGRIRAAGERLALLVRDFSSSRVRTMREADGHSTWSTEWIALQSAIAAVQVLERGSL